MTLAQTISGVVKDQDDNLLFGATVYSSLNGKSTITNEDGVFSITSTKGKNKLIISYVGYIPIVFNIDGNTLNIGIIKLENDSLEEVVISGTLSQVSKLKSAVQIELYSADFFKATPKASFFEAIEGINGIRPQLNCNVCNTGDIHINGLEGPYTFVLIDGMPIVSGLSTVYGLTGIPQALIERIENAGSSGLHTICNADQSYETIARLLEAALFYTHLPTLAMALMGVLGIVVLQRFFPRMPAILTVAVISTATSFLIDYEAMGGAIVNSIDIDGLFSFKIPSFDFNAMGTLFIYAITISLIGFMEAISVAKSMAATTKQRLDVNQELIGQGLSNIASSFFQGYAVSGSFSRSAVNLTAGAVTGFSSVVTAIIVGLTILWLTPLLYHLPQATLAAIILMSVVNLVHFSPLRHAWKVEKHDGWVGLLTFIMTLIFAPHLENGIAFGIIMSLGLFLYRTMEPNFTELSVQKGSIIASRFVDDTTEVSNAVKIAKWSGSLYFANAAYFETKLLELISNNKELKYIIVDVASIVQVDASGEQVLRNLVESCSDSGVEILFARTDRLEAELYRSGFKKRFGENRFFDLRADALKHVWQELEANEQEQELDEEQDHILDIDDGLNTA